MSDNIMDKLAARARVKVIKPEPGSDDRTSLCGEPLEKGFDAEGNVEHFFTIPASQADYINSAFIHYKVTEPFIPGVDDATTLPVLDKEFACQVEGCGKSFKTLQALTAHGRAHQ